MILECNACGDAEGFVEPCKLKLPSWINPKEQINYCPQCGEEADWEESKEENLK